MDRSYTTLSVELFDVEYRDLKIWLRGHSRTLKLVPFESLGAVSCSPSIVTMAVSVAVCEIFGVKEWCNLENRVTVCSRSLEMAPFDRSHAVAVPEISSCRGTTGALQSQTEHTS